MAPYETTMLELVRNLSSICKWLIILVNIFFNFFFFYQKITLKKKTTSTTRSTMIEFNLLRLKFKSLYILQCNLNTNIIACNYRLVLHVTIRQFIYEVETRLEINLFVSIKFYQTLRVLELKRGLIITLVKEPEKVVVHSSIVIIDMHMPPLAELIYFSRNFFLSYMFSNFSFIVQNY